jgi:hypothetical protein
LCMIVSILHEQPQKYFQKFNNHHHHTSQTTINDWHMPVSPHCPKNDVKI